MKSLKILRAVSGALVLFAALAGTGGGLFAGGQKSDTGTAAAMPTELVICYLPNEASEEYAEYRGMLQGDLSKALGIKITEVNAADYNAVVEAMRTRHADIAFFGPVTYVQAAERARAEALVLAVPHGDKGQSGYTSKIIVKAGSPIKSLADLRGKTFAFVDPASTSGNYVPTLELMNAFGLNNEDLHTNGRFFSSVSFSGKHQNGLQAVINGDVDAAPVASDILEAEIAGGRAKESDFTVIHESPRIPTAPMAVRGELPSEIKAKLKQFFLTYKNPDYFVYMLGFKPEQNASFVEADDRDYDYVRDLMAKVIPQ
ncbi:MAG: phosphate/phosphite/phosphonate ABC transporter substrate-binding protein [Treponema sp.]|jgi:phosphonate transport system substrate-binding protein|nr:phosphate/phosphite/phosphonate ABC transporter substrate-binding protein [Treponema sp.]